MRRAFVLISLLALFSQAIPAGATTTRIDFEATGVTTTGDSERAWLAGPIQQVRGEETEGVLTFNDPVPGLPASGETRGSINFNLDTRTFDGRVWGEGTLEFPEGGFALTFAGDVHLDGRMLVADYVGVGNGYGEYDGMQMRLTAHETVGLGPFPSVTEFDGVLFIPADRG